MKIIPAIDIISGKCVRLVKGDYGQKKIYSDDPLKIAKFFEKSGLKNLHLVDLEGAKEGRVVNWETIEKIAKNTGLLIEFGGGIRDKGDIKKLLGLGIDRIILGSLVLNEPENFNKILSEFKSKVVVSVDVRKNSIYYRGWLKKSRKKLYPFLKELSTAGAKTIICTDIERDGMIKGPNFSLYKKLVKEFPELEIIASGGVSSAKDLQKLSKIGVFGAIVGKAIYEKKINISELKT
jgi:phosphoribosylformimino-5-aminoimidazole carboxamide ribotide isomerase